MDGEQLGVVEGGRRLFRVRELAAGLKALLEDEVGVVWVVGEVANLFRARSGHCYFTLKDEGAQLRAVLFRGNLARIPFDPEDGLEVVVRAEVGLYEPRGDLQLLVQTLEPRGVGPLQLAFEQLRARLEAEGLFDPAARRPLPAWPRRIGVVTSPVGAALHDVLEVSGRRAPALPILLAPTRVQGDGVDAEIEAALAAVVRAPEVDLVLLVRGGGSLEDLVAFNSERVARAIRACSVPVVTGVGHEVDLTIADLAADARAPTPSAAAELAVPDLAPWRERLERERRRLDVAFRGRIARAAARLDRLADGLHAFAPHTRVAAQRARLEAARLGLGRAARHCLRERAQRRDELGRRLVHAGRGLSRFLRPRAEAARERLYRAPPERLAAVAARLRGQMGRLHALSPLAVLGRGYAIARREDGGILRRAGEARVGEPVRIQLGEGALRTRVEAVEGEEP